MPRAHWPHRNGRPSVEVVLTLAQSGQPLPRILLADTGAGSHKIGIDLLLKEADCLRCGGRLYLAIVLAGAYSGSFRTYFLPVQVPALGFDQDLRVVAVPSVPRGFDGIACFSFLNRFTYGNFGDAGRFGLET